MLKNSKTFSSFSVSEIPVALKFYKDVLGLDVREIPEGLELHFPTGSWAFVYPKLEHSPATYTVLNFIVDDIEQAVDELSSKGVTFERYDMKWSSPDEKGIYRRGDTEEIGPKGIAWFTDPAGNIFSVMEER